MSLLFTESLLFIAAIITIAAGIVILIWPRVLAYIIGIYLIIVGLAALVGVLR